MKKEKEVLRGENMVGRREYTAGRTSTLHPADPDSMPVHNIIS